MVDNHIEYSKWYPYYLYCFFYYIYCIPYYIYNKEYTLTICTNLRSTTYNHNNHFTLIEYLQWYPYYVLRICYSIHNTHNTYHQTHTKKVTNKLRFPNMTRHKHKLTIISLILITSQHFILPSSINIPTNHKQYTNKNPMSPFPLSYHIAIPPTYTHNSPLHPLSSTIQNNNNTISYSKPPLETTINSHYSCTTISPQILLTRHNTPPNIPHMTNTTHTQNIPHYH